MPAFIEFGRAGLIILILKSWQRSGQENVYQSGEVYVSDAVSQLNTSDISSITVVM